MFPLLRREPKIIYHFTKKENVNNIIESKTLKKFKDTYVFVCESYEDCIEVIKNTILNPEARYVDFDGIVKKHKNVNIEDYVILKLKTRYSDTLKWHKSASSDNENIDGLTLAYKGNLPITYLETLNIKL